MSTNCRPSIRLIGRLVLVGIGLAVVLAQSDRAFASDARVAPPGSISRGLTYSEWAARWWQWALSAPTSINPLFDPTGADCAVGQSGRVWFLAGLPFPGSVTRRCTVPAGYALLFPVLNLAYFAFTSDPPNTRTEEFVRSQVTCMQGATNLHASIDGEPIDNIAEFRERSVLFDVQLPADNVLGLTPDVAPGLLLSPSADEGFYLFVKPLPVGQHVVTFGGTYPAAGNCPGAPLNATYNLKVAVGR